MVKKATEKAQGLGRQTRRAGALGQERWRASLSSGRKKLRSGSAVAESQRRKPSG